MKLTKEQAEAITFLLGVPQFQVYMELMGAKGEESMQQLIHAKDNLETKQGKAQAYTEMVDVVANAKKTFEQYQNSK